MKDEPRGCVLALFLGAGGVVAAAVLIVQRALDALGQHYGDTPFQIAGLVLILAGVALVVALVLLVYSVIWRSHQRGKLIMPDERTALFPVVDKGKAGLVNPNPERAQIMAAMLANANGNLRAATVRSALEARPAPWSELPPPAQPAELPAPAPATFPSRVEVYNAPIPPTLALPVGVDGSNRQVALPLRGLGNVVIGGLQNCGKSELLGSMAAGLLRQDPAGERSQLAIVDMKLVSFGNLPPTVAGLRWPVAVDLESAHEIVAAVRAECQRRYEMLLAARARTLEEYEQRTGERLPYVTVLIDEIADLTCDDDRSRSQRFVSSALDVARKGRAAGLSLVMATQRPSVDVLPSSLRNLAGTAVAFKVSRNHDSIAVLGEPGAELLPQRPGRCLVKRSGLVEVQAYACGLEGGRFDAFIAALPTSGSRSREQVIDGIPVAGWPGTGTSTTVNRPEPAPAAGIPAFRTDDQSAYTAEQIAYIRQRYAALGSLKAVQRELYGGQEGGYWFYRIREVAT